MRPFIPVLLSCSVIVSVAGLIVFAATPLLTKLYTAKTRYYLWLIILIDLMLPFFPAVEYAAVEVSVPAQAAVFFGAADGGAHAEPPMSSPAHPRPDSAPNPSPGTFLPRFDAAVIWAAGVLLFLAYHMVRHIRFVCMTRRWSEPVTDGGAFRLLGALCEETGMAKNVRLFLCPCVSTPMATGFVRHSILLPYQEYDPGELRYILLHELTHIRRRDLLYRVFTLLVTAIHWFNPVVYLIGSRIDLLSEISCDNEIVRGADGDDRMRYIESIIGAAGRRSPVRTAVSTGFFGGKNDMKHRIASIMDTGRKRAGLLLVCVVLVITFGMGTVFTVALPVAAADSAPVTLTAETLEPIFSREGWVDAGFGTPHPLVMGEIEMDQAIAMGKAATARYLSQLDVGGKDYTADDIKTNDATLLQFGAGESQFGPNDPPLDPKRDYWELSFSIDGMESCTATISMHAQTGLITSFFLYNLQLDAGTALRPERLLSSYMEDLGAGGFAPIGEYDQFVEDVVAVSIVKDIAGGAGQVRLSMWNNTADSRLLSGMDLSGMDVWLQMQPGGTWLPNGLAVE